MLSFILRRLLLMIPTTLGVAVVVFALYHAAPGDPATVMMGMGSGGAMGQNSDAEAKIDAFSRKHGLDRNPVIQFLDYMGPFNLSRDGHPWFSTPYTERKTEEVKLKDGSKVLEGKPLEIAYLQDTTDAEREALEGALAVVLDPDSSGPARTAARGEFVRAAGAGLPPLFTALYELRTDTATESGHAAIAEVSAVLTEVTGYTPAPAAELVESKGDSALIRNWFAWYYAHGGYRVKNTGEKPWGGLLTGDLGREMQNRTPILEELGRRLKVTMPLALVSTLLAYLIALPLGIFSARRQGTLIDGAVTTNLFVLYSVPTFWMGLILILVFGQTGLGWFPSLSLHDKDAADFTSGQYFWDTLWHCVLPVVTLTYGSLAFLSRMARASLLDTIRQDYIRTARAKGLSERVVVYKHALRNSMIPVLTLLASILPILIGGSIIVEKVFDIPGMGKYIFEGLLRRDFYIMMACSIMVGVMTQFGILLSDISYSLVDPRIRHD